MQPAQTTMDSAHDRTPAAHVECMVNTLLSVATMQHTKIDVKQRAMIVGLAPLTMIHHKKVPTWRNRDFLIPSPVPPECGLTETVTSVQGDAVQHAYYAPPCKMTRNAGRVLVKSNWTLITPTYELDVLLHLHQEYTAASAPLEVVLGASALGDMRLSTTSSRMQVVDVRQTQRLVEEASPEDVGAYVHMMHRVFATADDADPTRRVINRDDATEGATLRYITRGGGVVKNVSQTKLVLPKTPMIEPTGRVHLGDDIVTIDAQLPVAWLSAYRMFDKMDSRDGTLQLRAPPIELVNACEVVLLMCGTLACRAIDEQRVRAAPCDTTTMRRLVAGRRLWRLLYDAMEGFDDFGRCFVGQRPGVGEMEQMGLGMLLAASEADPTRWSIVKPGAVSAHASMQMVAPTALGDACRASEQLQRWFDVRVEPMDMLVGRYDIGKLAGVVVDESALRSVYVRVCGAQHRLVSQLHTAYARIVDMLRREPTSSKVRTAIAETRRAAGEQSMALYLGVLQMQRSRCEACAARESQPPLLRPIDVHACTVCCKAGLCNVCYSLTDGACPECIPKRREVEKANIEHAMKMAHESELVGVRLEMTKLVGTLEVEQAKVRELKSVQSLLELDAPKPGRPRRKNKGGKVANGGETTDARAREEVRALRASAEDAEEELRALREQFDEANAVHAAQQRRDAAAIERLGGQLEQQAREFAATTARHEAALTEAATAEVAEHERLAADAADARRRLDNAHEEAADARRRLDDVQEEAAVARHESEFEKRVLRCEMDELERETVRVVYTQRVRRNKTLDDVLHAISTLRDSEVSDLRQRVVTLEGAACGRALQGAPVGGHPAVPDVQCGRPFVNKRSGSLQCIRNARRGGTSTSWWRRRPIVQPTAGRGAVACKTL